MKIGLVGWGIEVQSAYRYFGPKHYYVLGSEETREDFPVSENVEIHSLSGKRSPGLVGNVEDLSYLDYYGDCDMVIFQGAARKNLEKKFGETDPFWGKAKTTLDIFFEKCPTKNTIGVTGTKGKGTTTTLIHELLKASGKHAVIGGNIGIPVLDLLPEITSETWVVLELSNFQLYKFSYSPHIAVHLMMMREHIDEWHKTMDDYALAKRNIFAHQSPDDLAIYLEENEYSKANSAYSPGKKIPYFSLPGAVVDNGNVVIDEQKIVGVDEVGLLGAHNLQNICAAVTAVWQIHHDINTYKEVLRSFRGLEHRLQLAGEIDGVRYYDDSFGTTPDTAIVAMDAFKETKVMIVGGHDKGNPMEPMVRRLIADDVAHVVFIGSTGDKLRQIAINQGLDPARTTYREAGNSWTMEEIVATARKQAAPGDVVLLSTGSASFGLFKDYKDRGEQFMSIVSQLAS